MLCALVSWLGARQQPLLEDAQLKTGDLLLLYAPSGWCSLAFECVCAGIIVAYSSSDVRVLVCNNLQTPHLVRLSVVLEQYCSTWRWFGVTRHLSFDNAELAAQITKQFGPLVKRIRITKEPVTQPLIILSAYAALGLLHSIKDARLYNCDDLLQHGDLDQSLSSGVQLGVNRYFSLQ